VSPNEPNGVELVLKPSSHPAVGPFRSALVADGIPFTAFTVDDARSEYDRLVALGVRFTQPPTAYEAMVIAVFSDTCGGPREARNNVDRSGNASIGRQSLGDQQRRCNRE
jgi:hypothetical protein